MATKLTGQEAIHQMVTDKYIEFLEKGVVPWQKTWVGGPNAAPMSVATGKPYRGVNVFLLGCAGYTNPWWLTYKQAQALGGNVKRGESSSFAIFWKRVSKTTEDAETGEENDHSYWLLRYYRVFNVDQCELPESVTKKYSAPTVELPPAFGTVEAAEELWANMPNKPAVTSRDEGNAWYEYDTDTVNVPPRERFTSPDGYYGALYHELAHSTRHESRLARRTTPARFGSEDYSREELVAEMTSGFLCNEVGLTGEFTNSVAYIQGWLKALQNDRRLVVVAAGQAEKAASYIAGRTEQKAEIEAKAA